jgi:DNA topoisomerase-3
MEKAGAADMDDDVERKGLGTPATRASIIEKLVKDGFVRREKKKMIPTEDGMKLITILPDTVKSPQLTADWENALVQVSKGTYPMDKFMSGIEQMVSELVSKYEGIGASSIDNPFSTGQESLGDCPKCKSAVVKGKYGPYCSGKCGMLLGRAMGVTLSEGDVKSLLNGKKILVKNLHAKSGKTFDAYLEPDGIEDFSYTDRNGNERSGSQYRFNMSFPSKKKN